MLNRDNKTERSSEYRANFPPIGRRSSKITQGKKEKKLEIWGKA